MKLTPYVFFYGRCEEALKFYAGVFHGTYEAMRNGDGPMKDHVPAETHDKIMHAKFTAPGIEFMAADGRATQAIDPDAGNITLAVEARRGSGRRSAFPSAFRRRQGDDAARRGLLGRPLRHARGPFR